MVKLQSRTCSECKREYQVRWDRPNLYCSRTCANRVTSRTRPTTRGFVMTAKGYKALYRPGHPMAMKTGYILEHRLVMADQLGRNLLPTEVVDHINGVKDDNRPENLRVMTKLAHDKHSNKGRKRRARCPSCGHHFLLRGHVDSAGVIVLDS